MNLKTAIIGVAAAVLAFGIGLGIPMISHAKFEITSYEQAKNLVENKESAPVAEADADKNEASDADAKKIDPEEEKANRKVKINGDTVMLEWDYLDWGIVGVNMAESDYFGVVNKLGFDPHTDPAVAMSDSIQESKGLKGYVSYYYLDNSSSVPVYYSGDKYLTETSSDVSADLSIVREVEFCDSAKDPFNWNDHWQIGYTCGYNYGEREKDFIRISHNDGGITASECDEIINYVSLPYIGGSFGNMDSVMKISEMIEKGEKDESASKDDFEKYEVKTNLGDCTLSISHYENTTYTDLGDGNATEKTSQMTSYWLVFGDYEFNAVFEDGNDQAIYASYYYYPKAD